MNDFVQTALQRGYCPDNLLVISNLAFFISAYLSYAYITKNNSKSRALLILPILIMLTGIGSSLFHTDQNIITLFFDMAPIYLFIFYSMFLILKELTRNLFAQVTFLTAYLGILVMTPYFVPVSFLNNSIRYIVTLGFAGLLALWVYKKYQGLGSILIAITGLFGISIILRTSDRYLCDLYSFGTHSYWHVGVAITAFFVTKFLVDLKAAKPRYYVPK